MDELNESFSSLEEAPLLDEFQVDDLLDLGELPEPEEEEEEEDDDKVAKKVVFVAFEKKESLHLLGISLPEETDAANLEWLSGFVHDCHSEHQQSSPAAVWRVKNEIFIPVKAKRSKRHRRAGKFWSISSASSPSPSPSPSSSSSSSSSSSYLFQETYQKKRGRRLKSSMAGERKCSHCGVQKTPQWRAGPNGPKTLCNACGVRFKSGRLLPEYRPACSPTFVSNLHSNKHRKVLEMRRKEERLGSFPVQ